MGLSIFGFMAWVGLSTLWSESAELTVAELNQTSTYLALFVGTVIAAQRLGGTARIVNGLTIGLAVPVVLALLSRLEPSLFPKPTLPEIVPDARPRLSYPFDYWNAVALWVAMAVPFFLHLATRENIGRAWRAAGVALLPASGLVLYFTFSRGGLVCTLLAAAIFVAFTERRVQALLAVAVGGAGAVILIVVGRSYRALNDGLIDTAAAREQGDKLLVLTIVVTAVVWLVARAAQRIEWRPQIPPRRARLALIAAAALGLVLALGVAAQADLGSRFDNLSSGTSADGSQGQRIEGRFLSRSGNGRTEYWRAAIDEWQEHPVGGTGSGTWSLWWQRNPTIANYVRDPHSIWFETLGELGTIGVLALMAMFGSVLWAGWRALHRRPRDPVTPALLGAAAAFIVSASIDWTWELTALGAVFFACAGLLVARPGSSDRGGSLARGMAVALVAWVAIFVQAVPLIAEWQVDTSQAAVRDGDVNRAKEAAETARSVMPWAAGPNMQYAQALEVAGDYDAAAKYASEAIRQEPTNWATWLVLARIENRRGNEEQARRYLLKARSLNPGSSFWQRIGFTP